MHRRAGTTRSTRAVWPFLLAGCLCLVIRLPLLRVPLDADEGGYGYLARRWADGGRLYGPVWVDRPQGLLLSYRFVTGLGRSPVLIHLAAIAAALLLTAGVAAAAGALAGRPAAIWAALLVAVVGAAPHLQGFMFNGELAAGSFSATAVALALWYRRSPRFWLLLVAGAAGAIALLMKQSGFDGLVTALVIGWLAGRWRALLGVLAGAGLPIGLALLQAALTSWQDWWFAVIGYRLHTSAGSRGGLSGRWHNIVADLPRLWPDLLPLGALGLIGLAYVVVRRQGLPLLWFAVAGIGFAGGVFFFPHYWMQLVGPLCLLGALGLSLLPGRAAVALVVLASLPATSWTIRATAASPDHRDRLAVPDGRLLANRDIAPWLRAQARPGDQLYAFVSSADLYYTTGLHTDFRYLWQANLEAIPNAVPELRDYLAGPDRPRWVVLYQQPAVIDPSGGIQRVLDQGYRLATTIDGYRILTQVP
jgi:4-amino-4-deoxy-L-arabinose transferase-like glycosyltransferase